VPVIHA